MASCSGCETVKCTSCETLSFSMLTVFLVYLLSHFGFLSQIKEFIDPNSSFDSGLFVFSHVNTKKTIRTKKTDSNVVLRAIKECLLENISIRSAAVAHGIDKSTLQRYITKIKANFDDISTLADSVLLEFIGIKSMRLPQNMVCLFFSFFTSLLSLKCSSISFFSFYVRCSL